MGGAWIDRFSPRLAHELRWRQSHGAGRIGQPSAEKEHPMFQRTFITLPTVVCLGSLSACASEVVPSDEIARTSEAVTSCPTDSNAGQELAAATIAFNLMVLAAEQAQSDGDLLAARSILAPQRYTYLPGTTFNSWEAIGPGIQFDQSDPLYSHVSAKMQAILALGQTDPTVGSYLANGLFFAQQFTNGEVYPSIFSIPALAQYKTGTTTVHLADPNSKNNSHQATLVSGYWCASTSVTINESVSDTSDYLPISFPNITDWRSRPSSYVGVTGGTAQGQTIDNANESFTPFQGRTGSNPYLLVSINGVAQNWAFEKFSPVNCYNNSNATCTSMLIVDPVPYSEPGAQYGSNNAILGTQANPFIIDSNLLLADPSHAGQWATRTVNGTQQWGTFSTPITRGGVTEYEYVESY
jgi:hypothetical protein